MDERLPLGSPDAATLAMLLEKERDERRALEQERKRLQAGLARQNERLIQLERQVAGLMAHLQNLEQEHTGLQDQNARLRQQVAALQLEATRQPGDEPRMVHQPDPWPSTHTKGIPSERPRKKRDGRHNRGRQRSATVDEQHDHAVDACPRCGSRLTGGWVHRTIEVIDLPPQQRAQVTAHRLLGRYCGHCRRRVLPSPIGVEAGRIGRRRFGPRLIAAVATMVAVERLPLRQLRARLAREYDLQLSQGGVVGLLQVAAARAGPADAAIREAVRASPVVHADETGWREDGIPSYIWSISTPTARSYHLDQRRSGEVIDTLLGAEYAGVLVTDFYAAYDHLPGMKQRCWSHLWRDIAALALEYPDDQDLAAWIIGVRTIYQAAMAPRPPEEAGMTPQAVKRRSQRAHGYEQQLLLLCPDDLPATRPEATLAKRIRRYRAELFTFVRELEVPPTNNAAERAVRPLVIARKISGGTRSATGSATRMTLASVAQTVTLQQLDHAAVWHHLLLHPDSHPF